MASRFAMSKQMQPGSIMMTFAAKAISMELQGRENGGEKVCLRQ